MAKESIIRHNTADYSIAVQTIKDAILRSQYQAAKLVNREMLSLYYGIGRYISTKSRYGFWGTGAIKAISERLRKEMPGLKGFSESSLKNMRMFYEEWSPVLEASQHESSISPIVIGEIETTTLLSSKSPIMTDDLELFGNLSFTHHIRILNGEKNVDKRWKYIKLTLENKWDTRYLQQQIKDNAADKYGAMPSNFNVTIKDNRDANKALNMFKDEYLLDFINTEVIGIRDCQDVDERNICNLPAKNSGLTSCFTLC